MVTGTTCGDNRGQWARPRLAAPSRPSNPKETAGSRGIHVPPYKSSGKTKLCARARRCANGGARGGNSALPIVENTRQKQRHLGNPIGWRSPAAAWGLVWLLGQPGDFLSMATQNSPRAAARARGEFRFGPAGSYGFPLLRNPGNPWRIFRGSLGNPWGSRGNPCRMGQGRARGGPAPRAWRVFPRRVAQGRRVRGGPPSRMACFPAQHGPGPPRARRPRPSRIARSQTEWARAAARATASPVARSVSSTQGGQGRRARVGSSARARDQESLRESSGRASRRTARGLLGLSSGSWISGGRGLLGNLQRVLRMLQSVQLSLGCHW